MIVKFSLTLAVRWKERKSGAAVWKELVMINGLFQFGSPDFRLHLAWGDWLEKEEVARK